MTSLEEYTNNTHKIAEQGTLDAISVVEYRLSELCEIIRKAQEEIEPLEIQLKYMPGSVEFHKAKDHFYALAHS